MSSSNSYKGFKDLDCWKKGRELKIVISALVKKFPPEEKYQLVSQMIRSSRSVTNNMAEGYGRFTYTDTRHFFVQARGSVAETIDHLVIALDENYISKEDFSEIEIMCEAVFKLINGYINYLDKQKRNPIS